MVQGVKDMKTLTLRKGINLEMVEEGHFNNDEEIKEGYVIVHVEGCKKLQGKWDGYRLPTFIFKELNKEEV